MLGHKVDKVIGEVNVYYTLTANYGLDMHPPNPLPTIKILKYIIFYKKIFYRIIFLLNLVQTNPSN